MLGEGQLNTHIQNGVLDVWRHWDGGKFALTCDPISANQASKDAFAKEITGARIPLRLGPLLKSINRTRALSDKERYAGGGDIADIRDLANYPLHPGESVSAFSCERIKLPVSVGAIIMSRVTSDGNGLALQTTYLSSGWDGIVRLRLTNESDRTILLSCGQTVAAMFAFDVEGAPSQPADKGAAHFGLDWDEVFNNQRDPFTKALNTVQAKSGLEVLFDVAKDAVKKNWATAILTLSLLGFGVTIGAYGQKIANFEKDSETLKRSAQQLARMPWAAAAEVRFMRDALDAESDVPVAPPTDDRTVVFTSIDKIEPLDTIPAGARLSSFVVSGRLIRRDGGSVLHLRVLRSGGANPPAVVTVNYLLANPRDSGS